MDPVTDVVMSGIIRHELPLHHLRDDVFSTMMPVDICGTVLRGYRNSRGIQLDLRSRLEALSKPLRKSAWQTFARFSIRRHVVEGVQFLTRSPTECFL